MKLITVIYFIVCITSIAAAKSRKKIKHDSKKLINKTKPSPAIIAIEIVDPNESKTSKNSKRTIDSSLGYGYHSPPKYQVYKYSQHDIPPYRGPPNIYPKGIKSHNFEIQKSVSYNLPQQQLNNYYQPGTTLYSTVNQQGQIGGLSSHLPQSHNEPQVPVIILKVYPSQLADPGSLHPNLPQSHPLASVVNNIDVQALLTKYVQNLLVMNQYYQPQQQHYQPQQQHYQPQQQHYEPQQQYYQPQQQHYQQYYQEQPQYQEQQQHYQQYTSQDDLLTHENYPKDSHTRVIFRTDKNKLGVSPEPETKTIQIAIPEGAYSAVQVETPDMHYGYTSPGDDSDSHQQYYYQQDSGQQSYEENADVQQNDEPTQNVEPPSENQTPYNYHAHQKRSKKNKYSSRIRQNVDDVIRLEPIQA